MVVVGAQNYSKIDRKRFSSNIPNADIQISGFQVENNGQNRQYLGYLPLQAACIFL